MTKQKTKTKPPSQGWHLLTMYSFVIMLLALAPLMFLSMVFRTIAHLLHWPVVHIMRDMALYNTKRSKTIIKELEAFNKQLAKKNVKTNK